MPFIGTKPSEILHSFEKCSQAFASSFSHGLTRSAERDLERGRDFRRGFGFGKEDVSEFDSD